ncbi:YgjV family protein [Shewanella maritima]|uniref:YgjV family protein n=1 Tax=Shewanella maritima TaxID=2520507 RepID=UPI00373550D3
MLFAISPELMLAQLVGFISMFVGWWASAQKQQRAFMSGNMAASTLTAVHFAMMGSPLGMANQLLNLLRFTAGQNSWCKQASRAHVFALLFSAVAIAQGLFFAVHWAEWCAVASGVIMSFSLLYLTGNQLKIAFVITNALNLCLSYYLMSWSGLIYQIVTIGILSYGLLQSVRERVETGELGEFVVDSQVKVKT